METPSFYEEQKIEKDSYYLFACFDHFNARLRIMDYRGNLMDIVNDVIDLSTNHNYTKAIIYSRREHVHVFVEKGFLLEAIFEGYFHGSHAYALTMYFDPDRKYNESWVKEDEILHKVLNPTNNTMQKQLPQDYELRKAVPTDAERLSELYSEVFEIYPTPLNDPMYIQSLMKSNAIFHIIEYKGTIVSTASAYIDRPYYNAEISDCATISEHRKHGLMKHLIVSLEGELRKNRVFCVYSMARALSYGMNQALHQLEYKYKGRMTKNCYIFDKLEDMNVWVKDLS
ncbi:putative beta-lysine N-acetyltransferase [Bacillus mesophilus]|uniref:Putative beta-lysine N-acetyltransferase n=1 Tax=Bacillus mesophilus TaxID=1808955 RepID=A0A6M0QDH1_9BACI|nr:putative beta-lysine N-acetyltransferase [Bacillus mesophilus]MBM7663530.1 putative beta-lysine N-acetyltransferase [Bacillus mesophilus]NEY74247.1 putative beta-lysine N-acetyltransferase [Bacillus mesophilus]